MIIIKHEIQFCIEIWKQINWLPLCGIFQQEEDRANRLNRINFIRFYGTRQSVVMLYDGITEKLNIGAAFTLFFYAG